MRILLTSVVVQSSRTGVTTHYNRLLAHLAERGESVQLITPADAPGWLKKVLGAFRRVAALLGPDGEVLYLELENFVSIWVTVRRKGAQNIDIVHAQDTTSGAAAVFGLSRKVPVVVTCHFNDDPPNEYKERYRLSAWTSRQLETWYQFLFRQPRAFIAVSDYTRRSAAVSYPQLSASTVIYNGVVFPASPVRAAGGPFVIINVGTLEERKNQRLLIETAYELRQRGFTDFRIWLLGEGPKRAEWQELARTKSVDTYVSFLGYRPNVPEFLQAASLYVHTALNESWGYSITEAIAADVPVLALSTGGLPEQFDRHKPGLLPLETTAAELADAILDYRDARRRKNLAGEQLAYARERFNLNAMTDQHLAFYQEALRSRPQRHSLRNLPVEL